MNYDQKSIESKWQTFWEKNKTLQTNSNTNKETVYALGMVPYASASGLHVGDPVRYAAKGIMSRLGRLGGKEVSRPMGWDAFGLPAEQYAIESGNSPAEFTAQNIRTFKRQLKQLGLSSDWAREISTTDREYYNW